MVTDTFNLKDINVKDLKKYDGKLLIAGGNITMGSGKIDGNEIVLIEFF